jgi:hypothetical protein
VLRPLQSRAHICRLVIMYACTYTRAHTALLIKRLNLLSYSGGFLKYSGVGDMHTCAYVQTMEEMEKLWLTIFILLLALPRAGSLSLSLSLHMRAMPRCTGLRRETQIWISNWTSEIQLSSLVRKDFFFVEDVPEDILYLAPAFSLFSRASLRCKYALHP